MKQLQNNFTTPEQSKRLLELGVPADSADCYYTDRRITIWYRSKFDKVDWSAKVGHDLFYLPCWSVGRLLEICKICCITEKLYKQIKNRIDLYKSATNGLVTEIIHEISKDNIHFSKLQED